MIQGKNKPPSVVSAQWKESELQDRAEEHRDSLNTSFVANMLHSHDILTSVFSKDQTVAERPPT